MKFGHKTIDFQKLKISDFIILLQIQLVIIKVRGKYLMLLKNRRDKENEMPAVQLNWASRKTYCR